MQSWPARRHARGNLWQREPALHQIDSRRLRGERGRSQKNNEAHANLYFRGAGNSQQQGLQVGWEHTDRRTDRHKVASTNSQHTQQQQSFGRQHHSIRGSIHSAPRSRVKTGHPQTRSYQHHDSHKRHFGIAAKDADLNAGILFCCKKNPKVRKAGNPDGCCQLMQRCKDDKQRAIFQSRSRMAGPDTGCQQWQRKA